MPRCRSCSPLARPISDRRPSCTGRRCSGRICATPCSPSCAGRRRPRSTRARKRRGRLHDEGSRARRIGHAGLDGRGPAVPQPQVRSHRDGARRRPRRALRRPPPRRGLARLSIRRRPAVPRDARRPGLDRQRDRHHQAAHPRRPTRGDRAGDRRERAAAPPHRAPGETFGRPRPADRDRLRVLGTSRWLCRDRSARHAGRLRQDEEPRGVIPGQRSPLAVLDHRSRAEGLQVPDRMVSPAAQRSDGQGVRQPPLERRDDAALRQGVRGHHRARCRIVAPPARRALRLHDQGGDAPCLRRGLPAPRHPDRGRRGGNDRRPDPRHHQPRPESASLGRRRVLRPAVRARDDPRARRLRLPRGGSTRLARPSMNNRLAFILGIRPDVIRASLIIKHLRRYADCELHRIWSVQHYSDNLKDIFFRELDVVPAEIDLACGGETDAHIAASVISGLYPVLRHLDPAAAVFLGDNNTTLGAIAAAQLNVPVVHIEGCMRSYDWRMPEEKYRTTIDHLADVIYAYVDEYKTQGIREGLNPANIVVVGNPIVDVLEHYYFSRLSRYEAMMTDAFFADRGVRRGEYYLMTCHRRENVEQRGTLEAILRLVGEAPHPVYFPASY